MVQPIRPQDATGIYQRQLLGAEQAGGGTRRAGEAARGGGRWTDQVSLSDDARSFARVMQAVAQQGEVRPDRVQQLRDQVASGAYRVDADVIARTLVERGFRP